VKAIVGIAVFLVGAAFAAGQNTTNGTARASGNCVVAHSGNNDTINFNSCSLSKEQMEKLVALLNEILEGQDSESINSKLDKLQASIDEMLAASHPKLTILPGHDVIDGNGNHQQLFTLTTNRPIPGANLLLQFSGRWTQSPSVVRVNDAEMCGVQGCRQKDWDHYPQHNGDFREGACILQSRYGNHGVDSVEGFSGVEICRIGTGWL